MIVILSDLPLEEKVDVGHYEIKIKQDLRALVSSSNLHNTIGIDLKCNLNLWDTTRRRRNAREFELSKKIVVLG